MSCTVTAPVSMRKVMLALLLLPWCSLYTMQRMAWTSSPAHASCLTSPNPIGELSTSALRLIIHKQELGYLLRATHSHPRASSASIGFLSQHTHQVRFS
uniref:Secreted protein n=1 Tax=Lotus japonicus TaxID=34305 RepID=I3SGP3_LOTJA|nr:unknown [Lotus japonicus]